ncbi:MAG: ArgR family transcriptional regulator [Acidimicrobiia bacterium]|nr:ArgR family transcriptional regulator [Acidimicrobiia bacterium]MBT8248661.1 ArgR family transcriptional regulator [Acidimicrobiia bacterium]NNC44144.1 ArgR family transcriptional regulator [Acidimicrobiia bacterium]NND13200.1 ArgR family transcriptional regulator [Acidimicrobiia bacterium]NNL26835.1 ArgR family transcriptional regulator [Acidimicrobiia bacterium]
MDTERRRRTIRQLIVETGVTSQNQIRERLATEGFVVTQATVSRDLAAVGARKSGNGPSATYVLGPPNQTSTDLTNALNTFGISIASSANIVVVRTEPSAAGVVAGAIDRAGLTSVIGTVAGDDTVIVITADPTGGEALANRLDPGAMEELT